MKNTINKASTVYLRGIKDLLRKSKARDTSGKFIAEGKKIVHDISGKSHQVDSILCSAEFTEKYPDEIERFFSKQIHVFSVNNAFFEKLSILRNSQGVLAVLNKPQYSYNTLSFKSDTFLVIFDGIQDPGNMGTLIRTAAAFNAGAVFLHGKTVDIFNPKVVRASSGMVLNIPILPANLEIITELKSEGYKILAADNSRSESIPIADVKPEFGKNIIVFGSEGAGLSREMLSISDASFYIPIQKEVESLNVAAACSISMYYFSNYCK